MSKISVVIPVYNTEKYLRKCLDSVINQTFKDIEIICVDDGSTDNSLDILKEYQKNDSRFVILQQNHIGAGEARNKGINVATGKYIQFLDSDDFFELNMLDEMYKRANKFDADMVVCSSKNVDESDNIIESKNPNNTIQIDKVPIDTPFSYKNYPNEIFTLFNVAPWNKLCLKEIITKNNLLFQNLKTCNDVSFGHILRICAKRIVVFDNELVNYRYRRKGSIAEYRANYASNIVKSALYIEKYLKEQGLYDKLEIGFIKTFINHIRFETSLCNKKQYEKFLKELKELMPNNWNRFKAALKKDYLTLDYLYKIIGKKRVMLWGASLFLKELLENEPKANPNILGVIDKNPNNLGKMFGNYKIYPPEALNELKPDEVIMTIFNNNEKIYEELKKEFKEKYSNIKLMGNIFSERIGVYND